MLFVHLIVLDVYLTYAVLLPWREKKEEKSQGFYDYSTVSIHDVQSIGVFKIIQ